MTISESADTATPGALAQRDRVTVAAIQLCSGAEVSANLTRIDALVAQAARQGAELVVLPENAAVFSGDGLAKVAAREAPGHGPIQDFLAQCAARHGLWLSSGSIPLVDEDPGKVRAAQLLYDGAGEVRARYDKIHLFDVQAGDRSYRESATIAPGESPVLVATPWGIVGLSICYDLRFPELYRAGARQEATIWLVPSAFTAATGEAHWELLLRSRAVENLCFMVAPDQGAGPTGKGATWGHSAVVDPWGEMLAELPQRGEGVALATLDLAAQRQLRERFPVLEHRRLPVGDERPM